MNSTESAIIRLLDSAVGDPAVRSKIDVIVGRVGKKLEEDAQATMAWEPIPLDLYGQQLPDSVKSSWIFMLRKNSVTGAERHPNSIQRMMSYKGSGDFQTMPGPEWISHFLVSDGDEDIERRWISIPKNVWHQGVVGEGNWTVLSFHTCEASELIEERLEDGNIRAKLYM